MFRGFVVDDNAPARAALMEGLAELAGVTTVGCAGDEQTASAWLTDPANDWDIAIGADQVFDRATEISQLMDFCMAQSEAQALAANASSGLPPALSSEGIQRGQMAAALLAS